jgi:hypothetical protein
MIRAFFLVVDHVSRVPPVLVDLQCMILHDRAQLVESSGFIMMGGLIKIAVRYPEQEKQN